LARAAAKGRSFNPRAWWTAARSAVADNAPSAFGFVLLPVIVLFSLRALIPEPVPRLAVTLTEQERRGATGDKWKRGNAASAKWIPCYDPGSLDILGPDLPAMDEKQVRAAIARAAAAQKVWAKSTFRTRRLFLKVLRRFILENQDDICAVSARDSGKPLVDAAFGEVLVTLEKIRWLLREGERWLAPERRSSGAMMFYKSARVEFHPVGVMGAIVPWNYPFHNVFNPLLANLFAGNALVVKVSEHATWSSQYYGRIIDAALEAVGAPAGLVQIITGFEPLALI
jgi:acyl-CoA reductase-like NAD-dependent aldehyde dehydrogenase